MKSTSHPDRKAYDEAFARACALEYPELDRFELQAGYAVDRERLQQAARVLQCPIKVNAPNWQHGRLLYTVARQYISWAVAPTVFLDIGTAKGFSAVVMSWAIADSGRGDHRIVSIDVVEPDTWVRRNSVVECEKLMTVEQFVAPFVAPDVGIEFLGGGSSRWLALTPPDLHVGFAFIDGKHTFQAVALEALTIEKRQLRGDVMVFDDMQIDEVARAVMQLRGYRKDSVHLGRTRAARGYCVAVKC